METSKESGKSKKQNVSGQDGRSGGGPGTSINEATEAEEEQKREEKNPEGCPEAPLTEDPGDDSASKASSSHAAAEAPEERPDVLDMMPFPLDSPGGACVTSLSLISLGMLNVHISIPKHIVVVDSNLVDSETVKR